MVSSRELGLMKEEFMHNFGAITYGLKWTIYKVAAITDNVDLIPDENIRTNDEIINFRSMYKEYKLNKTINVLRKNIESITTDILRLEEVVEAQLKEREEHSNHFELIKFFTEQLGIAAREFHNYLSENSDESESTKFQAYIPKLRTVAYSFHGIDFLSNLYDKNTDSVEVRLKWAAKHPEWK